MRAVDQILVVRSRALLVTWLAALMTIPFTAARAQAPQQPTLSPQQQQLAADLTFYAAHYAKNQFRIPMRDGVKLYTQVYTPLPGQFGDTGPYPFLMSRTPYSCGNYANDTSFPQVTENATLTHDGYILVCQDVRGRWESEGTWFEMTPSHDGKSIDESTDMYDTVEWLLKNIPANNGKVGILGISYPGFYTAAGIVDGHPAIKAASPQAPVTDLWMGDDAYHGGAMMLLANHSFYTFFKPQKNPLKDEPKNNFDFGTQDMYAFYLKMGTLGHLDTPEGGTNPYFHDQVVHTTYDDYWKIRNISTHMHGVKAAVMEVGGLFDAEDPVGPVKIFHAIDQQSPAAAENVLVEGPWVHGGWSRGPGDRLGEVRFGSDTSNFYQTEIEAPFFAHWLKGRAMAPLAKATVFETGTNVWKKYDQWPPRDAVARTLYLQPQGGLAWSPPKIQASRDDYISDPAHPVPFTPYVTGQDVPQRYMDDDQRFAATRPDVLVYATAPLKENVTVAGPVKPRLSIASTGTDSDFIVKLIDVFPEDTPEPDDSPELAGQASAKRSDAPPVFLAGYQMLVRGEPFRAKFRNSWDTPEPLTPGQPTAVNFSMPDISHTFLKGHRIMVQVQSSWFPLVDRNPQVFMDIYKAKPEDFVKATETVFHQAGAASGIELLVLP